MQVQIQESLKLIQLFLGGRGQQWLWLFSLWDPNICCKNEFISRADYLNADSDDFLNADSDTRGPLQLYFLFYLNALQERFS